MQDFNEYFWIWNLFEVTSLLCDVPQVALLYLYVIGYREDISQDGGTYYIKSQKAPMFVLLRSMSICCSLFIGELHFFLLNQIYISYIFFQVIKVYVLIDIWNLFKNQRGRKLFSFRQQ